MLIVVGPTASGKSALAMDLAEILQGEIISCDSVQVYRGFDIGSAKTPLSERRGIIHHLLDIIDPTDAFDASEYRQQALEAAKNIRAKGRLPIVVGGTGLYLRALLGQGWDDLPCDPILRKELDDLPLDELGKILMRLAPHRLSQIHPNDRLRLVRAAEVAILCHQQGISAKPFHRPQDMPKDVIAVVLDPPRHVLHQRIELRVGAMLQQNFVQEVRDLLHQGLSSASKPMQSIGYRQVAEFIDGFITESELPAKIAAATRQYAKRQCTWFRTMPATVRYRGGTSSDQYRSLVKLISSYCQNWQNI